MTRMSKLVFLSLIALTFLVYLSAAIAGTDTIPTRSTGQTITSDFFNVMKSVMGGVVVPRNVSGVPEDNTGDLGSSTYRWRDIWLSRKIQIGAVADDVSIVGESAGVSIKKAGVTKAVINTDGIDGAYIKAGSIPYTALATESKFRIQNFTSSGTFTVPTGVSRIQVLACGGGGGGGAGGSYNGSFVSEGGAGGGGGGGSVPMLTWIEVTPGESLTVTVGSGGNGSTAPATAGGGGGDTSILRSGTLLFKVKGGDAGGGGSNGGFGAGNGAGGGASDSVNVRRLQAGGGAGGAISTGSGNNGAAGNDSFYGTGGLAGAANAGAGSGGGGGGAGYGNGGQGGAGSNNAGASAGGTCSGGGGGGGANNGGSGGGLGQNGQNGGSGLARIIWIGPT